MRWGLRGAENAEEHVCRFSAALRLCVEIAPENRY
jgi:hypothetical protein